MRYTRIASAILAGLLLMSCNNAGENDAQKTVETEPASSNAADVTAEDDVSADDTTDESGDEEAPEANDTSSTDEAIPTVLQNQKHTLRFDENGEFRIVVFGDVQAGAPAPCKETLDGIKTIVDRESPDLVLFAGDNSVGFSNEKALEKYLTSMTEYLEENKIPWAHVYGNHDHEGGLSRERQQVVYESFEYCVSQTGPDDIKGVGNYVLPVYPSDETRTDPVFSVWGLDSGAYVTDDGLVGREATLDNTMFRGHPGTTYAYMPFSQVKWYYDSSVEIEEFAGHKVPGLMYFHIPLQEFYEVWLNPEQTGVVGVKEDPVCSGPLNSGMFTAMIERGDIKAVCCGHDHINDYSGEFCGVKLCYASNIGFDTYHDADIMGGRVFTVKESDPDNVETYISYLYGMSLKNLKTSKDVTIGFEDPSLYTIEGGEAADGAGVDGTVAAKLGEGESTITTGEPFKINTGRYVRMWVDLTDGKIDAVTMNVLGGSAFKLKTESSDIFYLADGETEWTTSPKGEALPDGFRGMIAFSAGALRGVKDKREIPSKDTAVLGFAFTTEGNVYVDNIQMVSSYTK